MLDTNEFLKKALIIKAKNKSELNILIARNFNKFLLAVQGSNDEVNRAAVENKKVSILLNPEIERRHDFGDWKNSGLNDVLCKLAFQNNVAIGIDLSAIPEDKLEKSLRIGKIMQNIRLCRKFKTKMLIFSSKKQMNSSDLMSIAFSLGMSTKQAKESLDLKEKS